MEWDEGLNKLERIQTTDLLTYLARGDIANAMVETQRQRILGLPRAARPKKWRSLALGEIAHKLRKSIRHVEQLMQVAKTYPPNLVPRDLEEPNQFPETWSFLLEATRLDNPWLAVTYALDNDWSLYDLKNAEQINTKHGYIYRITDRVYRPNKQGTVVCPQCGHAFRTVRKRGRKHARESVDDESAEATRDEPLQE